jgi:hypothetical protein
MSEPTTFYVMHGDTAMFHVPTYEAAVAKIDAQPAHIKRDITVWNNAGAIVAQFHSGIGRMVKTVAPNAKFEAGKTYWCTSICDSDCVYTITVIRRTAKTLYVTEYGKAKTLRIRIGYDGHEEVSPHGRYSMSATISASKVRS